MVDTAQVILLFIVVILTFLLLILGIQVFFILRNLRQTVSKANKVLDDTGLITESVSGPVSTLSTLVAGVRTGASFARFLNKKKSHKNRRKDEDYNE